MISLQNIEKSYPAGPARYYVLRRITIDIKEGDFITIMGPSGAGKSTLLSIIGMLDGTWSGEYYLLEQPVHKLNLKQRAELNTKNIGFVFQQYHLLDDLTVAENLDIPLSYRNVKGSQRQAMVDDTLDRFHIVGKKDLYPSHLSGGYQEPGLHRRCRADARSWNWRQYCRFQCDQLRAFAAAALQAPRSAGVGNGVLAPPE